MVRGFFENLKLNSFIVFTIPFSFVGIYTLNHFYVTGAYFWDGGLFSYFTTETNSWPMLWPEFQHHDPINGPPPFFQNHVMPIFYITSALNLGLSGASYFSLLLGMSAGLLGLSVYSLCHHQTCTYLALPAGLTTALSGPMLASVGFPHIEILIPALFISFMALRQQKKKLAFFSLTLCLLVREDAGLHVASILILTALVYWIFEGDIQRARRDLLTSSICVLYSLCALAFMSLIFPAEVSPLQHVYLGKPLGSHLSWLLVKERVYSFLTDKAYATWPILILLLLAFLKRDKFLAVGPIAVLPWVVLSLLAVRDGTLTSYYAFPIIITVAWPSIVWANRSICAPVQLLTSGLSIALFIGAGAGNHDNTPWRRLSIPNIAAINNFEAALIRVVERRSELGRIMVDDAVASLIPGALKIDEWVAQWAVDNLPNPDAVLYKPNSYRVDNTMAAIQASGLKERCRIAGTPFILATRGSLPADPFRCDPLTETQQD